MSNWVSKWMLWLNVAPCCRYRGGKPTRAHLPHDRLLQRPLQDCQVRPSPLPHWVKTSWPAGPQVPHRHRSGREPEECEREHRLARLCRVWKLRDHETSHRVRGQVISSIYWWPNFFLQSRGAQKEGVSNSVCYSFPGFPSWQTRSLAHMSEPHQRTLQIINKQLFFSADETKK